MKGMRKMRIVASVLTGYLLGSISPSAFLAKIKHENFREQGTGNLGATNTMVILGKWYGIFVMVFDFLKAFFSVKIAKWLVPSAPFVWMLAGLMAVVGHVFPFYLKFKGGKGLASFGGVVLGYDVFAFVILLVLSVVLMLLFDYGAAMPISAATLFPFFVLNDGLWAFMLSTALGLLIIVKHWSNLKKAYRGEDTRVREYIKKYLK